MQWRTAVAIGALGVMIGWSVGPRLQQQLAGPATAQPSRGPLPLGVERPPDASPLTEQLRSRMARQPRSPRASRNPFVFGGRSGTPRATGAAMPPGTAAAPSAADTAAEPPPAPVMTLSGVATEETGAGPVRTAIVNDGRGLLFLKLGDPLPGGETVVDIQETFVTIRDAAGRERTLRFR